MRRSAKKSSLLIPSSLSLGLCSSFLFTLATSSWAQNNLETSEEICKRLQPGRIESAKYLLAQSKKYQLNAKQYHLKANEAINDAKSLKGKADKLNALSGAVDANSPKEYRAAIEAFKDHAKQYKAHLENVERNIGVCKASEAEYQAQLKEFTLHTERFHIPEIRPPHVCPQLGISEAESGRVASSLRADNVRLTQSEAELASSEAKLRNSIENNKNATEALAKRNQLQEEERKLAGEFAKLKTEYELLEMQQTALLGTASKAKPIASTKSVQGKIKK